MSNTHDTEAPSADEIERIAFEWAHAAYCKGLGRPFSDIDLIRSRLRAATSKSQERIRELEEALRGMLSTWDAICNVKGWDKDHLYAAVEARAALKEPK